MDKLFWLCLFIGVYLTSAKIEHVTTKINDRLSIVLVHGDDEARMNHIQAYQYCRNLTWILNINSTKENPKVVDLLSIHDSYQLTKTIMPAILEKIDEMFWIGVVANWIEGPHGPRLRVRWTDRTLMTFKYFHSHLKAPEYVHPDHRYCGMCAYNTGKWDLDICAKRKFFCCEIINPKIPPDFPAHERRLKPAESDRDDDRKPKHH